MNLKNDLTLSKLNLSDKESVDFVHQTYIEAFPLSERRSFDIALSLHEDSAQKFSILLARKKDQMLGFFTFWDLGEFIFAEHFAIASVIRNSGVGQDVMDIFLSSQSKPIVLEVELPTTILSERRIGFYQRLGFRLWGNVQYHQPPYNKDGNPIPMKLMSFGNIDVAKNYIDIKNRIYSKVYNY